jgi:nucleobase:cation symporter-1, NCS1 family
MSETIETQAGGEFEREPVPEGARKGASAFWGMYAGEHTAGTEFMIGPLFVAWGVSAFDLLVGLLVGNLLAVLSWRFLTAPIATRLRLTLYYHLEQICGRRLVVIYNLANGVLFCFLAGAMVTVSATAVGVPFESFRMPTFQDTLPTGLPWCVAVVLIGSAMTFVAVKGYGFVARMGHLAAPWLFLVFVACGLVTLPKLESLELSRIWTGVPVAGHTRIGFWGVVFFSWFCNAAMHVGMSDLSIFRFARRPRYGWAASAGMFLGHYIAWISASLLFALELQRHGDGASSAPGPMVFAATGWAGLICVVIAGWTTANPTIYRAGLAFQSLVPGMRRTHGTLLAGAVCTVAGLFPAVAMKLLDFVGIYGTILCPVGAIILVDHYVSRRCGIQPFYASATGRGFNAAALLAWVVPVGLGAYFYLVQGVFASFLTLPVYLLTGVLFLGLSRWWHPLAKP